MKPWQGLNAKEIASIPNDEYRLQKVERILKERNQLKELSDEEICNIFNEYTGLGIHQKAADKEDLLVFARAILKKASEK